MECLLECWSEETTENPPPLEKEKILSTPSTINTIYFTPLNRKIGYATTSTKHLQL
jgi:hypothetical protein